MFFDKSYIERICSPDILTEERHNMTATEAINWIDMQGFRYEYEERAAILEYDGGLSRDDAECQALREITERIDEMKKS